jgi:hypothetical protein
LKPIETKVRDLFREPLSSKELQRWAAVLDPLRAGGAVGDARRVRRVDNRQCRAIRRSLATRI